MRGADLVAAALAQAGVKTVFSLSGNQIMPVYDAFIDTGIRLHHTRHEAAAGYMADAFAQVTGEVGIQLITAAPGFANALSPLYSALMAESPMVMLSGDSPRGQDGMGAFQELDQVAMSAPVTKLSFRSRTAEGLGHDIARAIRTAKSGRPGPVHLALPFDLLNADASKGVVPGKEAFAPEVTAPDGGLTGAAIEAIKSAERPVVITGPALNATRAVRAWKGGLAALADALDAPVIPMESPRGLSDPSLGAVAKALAEADVIVSLGKSFDFTTGFAKPPAMGDGARFVVLDPVPGMLERARRALGKRLIVAGPSDAAAAGRALLKAGLGGKRAEWRGRFAEAVAKRPASPAGGNPMHPTELCAAVQKVLDAADDPILVVDGGEFGQWAQAYISAPTRVINGISGAIGGAVCYAIAAKIARPGATVAILMGDGTAGFHFAEFETAHRYGADILAVIGHDARWNAEYQIQLRDYGENRLNECELDATDYGAAAAGFGCHGEMVDDPVGLEAALERAISSGKPACVAVAIEGVPAPSGSGH
ncbi:MAG: thiamine pyrophosphate-binding protein [Rhodospirillaceae bacterium]